jgi:hypothetical protein
MQIDKFHDIVDSERLHRFLNEGAPEGSASSKVCVFQDGARWVTLHTDERAAVITKAHKTFDTRAEALEDAVNGLRFLRDLEEFRS